MKRTPSSPGSTPSSKVKPDAVTPVAKGKKVASAPSRSREVREDRGPGQMKGGSGKDLKDELLESAPESERWNPVPGSSGQKAPSTPSDDEDEDGRSTKERLVTEGFTQSDRGRTRRAS